MKKQRKRVLCRVKEANNNDEIIFYRDGSARWRSHSAAPGHYWNWKLAHSDLGPILLYQHINDGFWRTDWESNDEFEVKVANTVAKALADLEVDNLLKGEYDNADKEKL